MAKSRRYVVRVALMPRPEAEERTVTALTELLEAFRYAGLIAFPVNSKQGVALDGSTVFDMRPPLGIADTYVWATGNAERMKSFGFNAEACPAAE